MLRDLRGCKQTSIDMADITNIAHMPIETLCRFQNQYCSIFVRTLNFQPKASNKKPLIEASPRKRWRIATTCAELSLPVWGTKRRAADYPGRYLPPRDYNITAAGP